MRAKREDVWLDSERDGAIILAMLTPDRAMDDFLNDGLRRGWSERTLTTYRRILYAFDARLPVDYDVTDIREADIRGFLGSKNGKSRGTIAHAEAVLASFFKWCYLNRKIKQNPMDRIERTRRIPATELDVTSVSADDARKLLKAAQGWTEKLTIGVLLYMGPRRRAVARLRLSDYDRKETKLRFREKGNKTIWKPVPHPLKALLEAAIEDGAIEAGRKYLAPTLAKPGPFLIPPEAYCPDPFRKGERDDRCVYDVVKRVAERAGVSAHVHALRAAFACFYLESNPADLEGLRELLGHRNIATTAIYLRKLNTEKAMDRVRGLDWGEEAA